MAKHGSGECQVCARELTVDSDGRLNNHGYKRPGWGWLVGGCPGVGHLPFPETDALEKARTMASDYAKAEDELADRIEANNGPVRLTVNTKYIGRNRQTETRSFASPEDARDFFLAVLADESSARSERRPYAVHALRDLSFNREPATPEDAELFARMRARKWGELVSRTVYAHRRSAESARGDVEYLSKRIAEGEALRAS